MKTRTDLSGERRHLYSTVLCLLLTSILCLCGRELAAEDQQSAIGKGAKAPNFNLNLVAPPEGGETTVRLYNLVGTKKRAKTQLVVLSFFATWCKPCRAEMPILQGIHEKYDHKEVRVLSIVVEGADSRPQKEIMKEVQAFAVEKKLTFPLLYDPFMKDMVASRYLGSQMELPGVYLIGPDGKIRRVFHEKRDDLPKQVQEVLKGLSAE